MIERTHRHHDCQRKGRVYRSNNNLRQRFECLSDNDAVGRFNSSAIFGFTVRRNGLPPRMEKGESPSLVKDGNVTRCKSGKLATGQPLLSTYQIFNFSLSTPTNHSSQLRLALQQNEPRFDMLACRNKVAAMDNSSAHALVGAAEFLMNSRKHQIFLLCTDI